MASSKTASSSPTMQTEKAAPKKNSKADTLSNTQEIFSQLFSSESSDDALAGTLLLVDLERVSPRENQPRTFFDADALDELSRDIADLRSRGGGVAGSGILQPLLVDADDAGAFRIVAGERRYRAAKLARCETVPVIVRESGTSEGTLAEWWEDALRENIQRQDLTPLEEARALSKMAEEGGYSVRVLAERIGKGKGYVEHRLALSKAGADVQELVSRRRDTLSIAREIDKVTDAGLRKNLIERALAGASVADLRQVIENPDAALRSAKAKEPRASDGTASEQNRVERQLQKLDYEGLLSVAIKALEYAVRKPVGAGEAEVRENGLAALEKRVSELKRSR